MSHKQCTEKDIYAIKIYLKEGYNYSKIGRKIEKHPSCIKRLVDDYKSKKTGVFYAYSCIKEKKKVRNQINSEKMIDNRPYIIETRSRIGDWEGDTVVGPRGGSKQVLLTNVERKSGYLLCRKLHNGSGKAVLEGTLDCFKNIPKYKQQTMTYDNGREFSQHKMIEYLTNLEIYFAHPYASHERGTNENTNGLLRQFFPKKTDFASVSENQLKYYVSLINFRPRKRLNYKAPYEVFFNKSLKLCNSC